MCARAPPAHAPPDPPICWKGYVSCVVAVATPQGGGLSVCRCATPAYPLSPTRCWRYRFSYPDFGGDCGLGRCKRPAEARCLPRCQSRRLGSKRLNPLLNSHIQTKNDFPRWEKCWQKLVLKCHRRAKLRPDQPVRGVKNVEVQLEAHAATAAEDNAMVSWLSMQTSEEQQHRKEKNHCEHMRDRSKSRGTTTERSPNKAEINLHTPPASSSPFSGTTLHFCLQTKSTLKAAHLERQFRDDICFQAHSLCG